MVGSGGGTTTQVQVPTTPAVTSFIEGTIPQLAATQQAAPLSQFAQPQVQQVAGLSPLQQWVQGQIQNIPNTPATTQQATNYLTGVGTRAGQTAAQNPDQMALDQLAYLTGGPIGSSPATLATMEAYDRLQAPSIQNTLNAMGMGRSGAGAEQLNLGRTAALVPALQQEVQNRATAVPQYINIGQGADQTQLAAAQQLTAQGQQAQNAQATGATLGGAQGLIEQQTAQRALTAPYEDYLRRQMLAQGVTSVGGYPMGSQTTQTTKGSSFLGK